MDRGRGVGPFLFNPGGHSTVYVDGREVASTAPFESRTLSLIPTSSGLTTASGSVQLTSGRHEIRVAARLKSLFARDPSLTTPYQLRLAWLTPEMRGATLDAAAAAARDAPTAIVFVHNEGAEGVDRSSLDLPLGQNELIAAVAAANPRTVVVLNTGDPVVMPWADRANAILQMWYPGQEGGAATADLLLGRANPSGKLPVTFPRHDGDAPTSTPLRYPGINGRQEYSEGVLVGYRWYDAKGIVPLFPFGHGLSYTTFAYSELTVRPRGDGFDVSFRVRNSGAVAGAEVAQVYVRCTWALRRETSAFAGNSITVASESPGTATCARVDTTCSRRSARSGWVELCVRRLSRRHAHRRCSRIGTHW
jgi:hypothetical protein